jgi:23S rRNA A2030 N6-methylase RlmJ
MANSYFGDFGDVWKHLGLMELLARVRPRYYWETHAGSAEYTLTPSPERAYGVYHFLATAERNAVLSSSRYYMGLKQLPQANGFPTLYLGSGLQAMLELGTTAEYLFCDLDPLSVNGLRRAAGDLSLAHRTRCAEADGVATVRRMGLDGGMTAVADVVVHIDPFEPLAPSGVDGQTPVELACKLSARGYKVVLWYGNFDNEGLRPGWLWRDLTARLSSSTDSAWCGDLTLVSLADGPGLRGCGLVCTNFGEPEYVRLEELGQALASTYVGTVFPNGGLGALTFRSWRTGSARP